MLIQIIRTDGFQGELAQIWKLSARQATNIELLNFVEVRTG